MANDFTGRILKINTPGTIPLANFKLSGGLWTGGTPADVFTMVDTAGRAYNWTFPADGSDVSINMRVWLSGPVTVTSIPHGEVQLYLDTR